MTLLYAIASDVGVMLLVTLNGMKLLPGGTEVSLNRKMKSSAQAEDLLPLAGNRNPSGDTEVDGEMI
jgi:hypothetical protein